MCRRFLLLVIVGLTIIFMRMASAETDELTSNSAAQESEALSEESDDVSFDKRKSRFLGQLGKRRNRFLQQIGKRGNRFLGKLGR